MSNTKIIKLTAKSILCDIEGTTTSINFVKNILFPFSYKHVNDYLTQNWNNSTVQNIVSELMELRNNNEIYSNAPQIVKDDESSLIESISNVVKYFIEKDYKIGPLKNLQGLIWEQGYKDEKFKGHVFDDVPIAFNKWSKSGILIYIYSSGSVKAQKLLFEHTDHGDLLHFIKGHFDTAIGHKQDKKSYENILKELNQVGKEVIFFTDIANEAYAANDVGITCVLLDRPGNGPLSKEDRDTFSVIETFNQIEIDLSV